MIEFLMACVAYVNLPYTILLTFVIFYWILSIMGLFDLDLLNLGHGHGHEIGSLDGNVGIEGDLGINANTGLDGSPDAGVGTGAELPPAVDGVATPDGGAGIETGAGSPDSPLEILKSFIPFHHSFFSSGSVPLTIFLSFLFLSMWAISILTNYYIGNSSVKVAILLAVPNFFISFAITKIVTYPLQVFFRQLAKSPEFDKSLIGKTCHVVTSQVNDAFGQAEISTKGAPLLINVRTKEGEGLEKGDCAIIIEEIDKGKGIYLIQRFIT